MDQHKLYRTIKALGEASFRSEEQLLAHVLQNIIVNEQIPIKGGRIWKLEPASGTYRVIYQAGEMDQISRNFRIKAAEYPMFLKLHRKGTVLGNETNHYLRTKGIRHYSATGVGEKVRWRDYTLYQYVIGINAEYMKQDMLYAMNIIGAALTAGLMSRRTERKAKLLEQDLDKAREIQKSILPAHELKFHNYEIYGISLPERVVGGDFFDYLQAKDDKDRLSIVVGDAASKGLSAAAQALYVSGALRMGVGFQTKISTLMTRLNELVNKTFTAEHFISMVYTEFTASDNGLVFYVNAGHSNPILLHTATNTVESLRATGQIIGPFPNEKYRTEFVLMKPGDLLLLYTDGIIEAANEHRQLYGEQRLIGRLREHCHRTPREICQLILEDVQVYNKILDFSDDKTVVVVKRVK